MCGPACERSHLRGQTRNVRTVLRGPAAPRLIPRAGLLAGLDRAADARVTLISAPAGSGKTSLLRAWTDGPGQRGRVAVVQVPRDQQDAQQFWLAVLRAIRLAAGAPGDGEPLAATPEFNQAAVAARVRAELAGQDELTFLVIDDLHELTSPEALTQLTRLVEQLPRSSCSSPAAWPRSWPRACSPSGRRSCSRPGAAPWA
jgi:LuxR family transcriptional regulator, maltose regulon positive regulatory protein